MVIEEVKQGWSSVTWDETLEEVTQGWLSTRVEVFPEDLKTAFRVPSFTATQTNHKNKLKKRIIDVFEQSKLDKTVPNGKSYRPRNLDFARVLAENVYRAFEGQQIKLASLDIENAFKNIPLRDSDRRKGGNLRETDKCNTLWAETEPRKQ